MLFCASCVVRYDHTFLRSDDVSVTRLGRAELTVTTAGEGSGARTRPPWALRVTGEAPKGRGNFILVKNIRATVNGQIYTHPDVRFDFSEASWAQTLTAHFIPMSGNPGGTVTINYRVLSNDSPGREVPEKIEFHVEKDSGTVVANPFLDFT